MTDKTTTSPFRAGRFWPAFLLLYACYQSAELVGTRMLHSALWQGLLMTAVLPLAALLGFLLYRAPLGAFALEARRSAGAWLAACFAGAIALKFLAVLAGAQAGIYTLAWKAAPEDALARLPMLLLITFIPSIAEDILTRGLWFRHGPLRSALPFVLLSTVVYVMNHTWRLANGPQEWLMLASFGLAYAVALQCSGSLWAAVGLHWGWNAANLLLDLTADVEARSSAAPFVSAAAHGVMLCSVLAVSGWLRGRAPRPKDLAPVVS